MIDTHCHLTFPDLCDQADQVIARAVDAGVHRLITVGTSLDDSTLAQSIAEHHDNVAFTAGIHPHEAGDFEPADADRLIAFAGDPRCVGFGEMGLDAHYPDPPRDRQRRCFAAQLDAIARRRADRPIVIHCRQAVDDTLAIIAESALDPRRFVFHCFTEPPDHCRQVLDAGCFVSFTGIVTYHNAPDVRASCLLVPDDRLMLETDSPYLSPAPHRKIRPNEPALIAATYAFVAELRGADLARFTAQTDANARQFFGLD